MKISFTKFFPAILISLLLLSSYLRANPEWMFFRSGVVGLANSPVNLIAIDSTLQKWCQIDPQEGACILQDTSWHFYNSVNSILKCTFSGFVIDKKNIFWGASDKGIFCFNGSEWKVFDTTNAELPIKYASCVAVDKFDNKWFWSDAGLVKYDNVNWSVIDTSGLNFGIKSVQQMLADSSGNLWMSTDSAFYMYDGSKWKTHFLSEVKVYHDFIGFMQIDNKGKLWLAIQRALIKYDGVNSKQYWPDNDDIGSSPYLINGFVFDKSNVCWISTYGFGLLRYDGKTWSYFNKSNSGLSGHTNCVATDKLGNVWVGLDFGTVCAYNPGGVVLDVRNEISNSTATDFKVSIEPNPVSSSGTISFELSKQAEISIKIFDEAGNEVKTLLMNEITSPGRQSITFDVSDLCAGVYVCSVSTNNLINTTKLVIF